MSESVMSERERRELGELEESLRADDRRLDEMLRLFVYDGWVRRLRWAMTGRRSRSRARRACEPGA